MQKTHELTYCALYRPKNTTANINLHISNTIGNRSAFTWSHHLMPRSFWDNTTLTHHKPHLTWSAGKVVSRSSFCHNTYLQSALPSCRNNPLSSLSSFLAINYLSLWAIPWHHHFHKTASEKYLSSCGDEWKKAINTPLWHFVYLVYQKFHPCAFFPHRLSPAERNEDVGNRELLAVK